MTIQKTEGFEGDPHGEWAGAEGFTAISIHGMHSVSRQNSGPKRENVLGSGVQRVQAVFRSLTINNYCARLLGAVIRTPIQSCAVISLRNRKRLAECIGQSILCK